MKYFSLSLLHPILISLWMLYPTLTHVATSSSIPHTLHLFCNQLLPVSKCFFLIKFYIRFCCIHSFGKPHDVAELNSASCRFYSPSTCRWTEVSSQLDEDHNRSIQECYLDWFLNAVFILTFDIQTVTAQTWKMWIQVSVGLWASGRLSK